jgi:pimeloyl-ACP methyl ester carboxylesterase
MERKHDPTSEGEVRQGTVVANGLRFAYLELGQGPLAVLLHGFPDTPYGWLDTLRTLAGRGYRAVAPFTRGYAPTQVPPTRVTTLQELAQDALALIPALGSESALLVAHDWGAATAYLAAAMAPERIEQLVAVGIPHPAVVRPSLRLLWVGRHFITLRLPGAVGRAGRRDLALLDTFYRRWSPTWDFGPEETAPVKAALAERANLDAAIGYYRGYRPGLAPALRAKLPMPTLAVAGRDDPALDVDVYEQARRKFAGEYRVAALPGGHFVHRESPDAFREALLSFLAAHR